MTSRYGTPMMAFVVAAAMALVASSEESGQIKIDNGGVATLPGILSYDGEGGRAFGAEIQFIQITGIDTPFHAGETLICRGCFLNFATGDNIVEDLPSGLSPVVEFSHWTETSFRMVGISLDSAVTF